MRVLVACEFSGKVRDAFIRAGHVAYSCDLDPGEGEYAEFHIQGDVTRYVRYGWDLMVAHPPCTYLAVSGARWFDEPGRRELQAGALSFVRLLMDAPIPRICVENPVSVISTHIRKPTQIVQPWQFGHGVTKATCLWLKNLPPLVPTNVVDGRFPEVHYMGGKNRGKRRSVTYHGIADAMAAQWGSLSG